MKSPTFTEIQLSEKYLATTFQKWADSLTECSDMLLQMEYDRIAFNKLLTLSDDYKENYYQTLFEVTRMKQDYYHQFWCSKEEIPTKTCM